MHQVGESLMGQDLACKTTECLDELSSPAESSDAHWHLLSATAH